MLRNKLIYFLELCLLLPFLPLLYFEGKKLRKKIIRLSPVSEYLSLPGDTNEKSILVIGESTVAGVGASEASQSIGAHLYHHTGEKSALLNLGKNGLKASRLRSLLLHGLDKEKKVFDVVVILIGANDCFKFTPPHKFRKAIKEFVDMLETQIGTTKIILPEIPPVHQFPAIPGLLQFFLGWHRKLLAAELKLLAKSNTKINLLELKHDFEPDFYAKDGIHPSDIGYNHMAKKISELFI
ncbi:lysophospholipase L1-like esterase [Mongoliibacter ruber]|uniref:Lysophospholipase L1-like esterase n=1 Tax=Mongoliibacter ruber TaxID=1750599 RepID=A0A2T0WJS0_9BACT|nr:lysophospholipase L1-like esterase [Mongoliibacter ruber]